MIPAVASAEYIMLKSGQSVAGAVIERTDEYIKVETDFDITLTYYLDEIEQILEQPEVKDEEPSISENTGEDLKEQEVLIIENLPPDQVRQLDAGKKASTARKKKVQKKKVTIYVTSWCPYCKKLEKFLRGNNIRYTRYNIERSAKGRKEYKRLGGGGVPIVKIGSKVIRGYNPQKIKAAL